MFSRSPAPIPEADIPRSVTSLAESFLTEARSSSELNLLHDGYMTDSISGSTLRGQSATFQLDGGGGANITQSMFMFFDGRSTWSGQFTGSSNDWSRAVTLLEDAH